MRKILAMVLTFCTVFSSVCTIVLAQEQSLFTASIEGTVSGNDAVMVEDIMVSGIVHEDESEAETTEETTVERNVEAADDTVSGGDADVTVPLPDEPVVGGVEAENIGNNDIFAKSGDEEYEGDGNDQSIAIGNCTFYYTVIDEKIVVTCVVPNVSGNEDVGEIVIPAMIDGKIVYRIGSNAFGNLAQNTGTIILPESITEIGAYAFADCSELALTLPSGLTEIEDYAFYNCKGLTGTPIFADGIKRIGENAFRQCTNLTGSLVLPDGIKEIGCYAFYNCNGLTGTLILPDSISYIGGSAFCECSGFSGDLKLPAGLEVVEDNVFSYCSGLTGSLMLPEGLTKIGDSAFLNCKGLSGELKLPDGLTEIGEAAFFGWDEYEGNYIEPHGCGFSGDLVIPDSVEIIGDLAFDGCKSFSGTLKLPANLTVIGSSAFSNCEGFKGELILPETIIKIGDSAFRRCRGFTGELKLSAGLTEIGSNAFYGCSGFTGDLKIPDSVKSIGVAAFQACNSLSRDIYMTGGVSSIANDSRNQSAFDRHYDQNTGESITVADITIHAPRGSYAETYAIENGYSYTDDNGYVHIGTGNNGNKEPENPEEPDVPPALLVNTTDVKVQITTKQSDADKAAGIQGGEYLQVEISDAVDENVLDELKKVAADKGLISLVILNIDLKVLEANGNLIRKVSEPNGELTFTIPVPEGVDGNLYDFFILRYHGDGVDTLPDLDDEPSTITFASNKFSAYAIVYKMKESGSDNINAGGSRPGSGTNADDNTQDNGSNNDDTDSNGNANGSDNGQSASGQASKDGVPRTGDKLPIAVPATATVIFAVLSCILRGQELFAKRAKKMRNR